MLQSESKVESQGLKGPIKAQAISIPTDCPAIVCQVRVHASSYRGGVGLTWFLEKLREAAQESQQVNNMKLANEIK